MFFSSTTSAKVLKNTLVPFAFLMFFPCSLSAQETFSRCDNSMVEACVAFLVANREHFKQYAFRASIEQNIVGIDERVGDQSWSTDMFIAEDFGSRSERKDWRILNLDASVFSLGDWHKEVIRSGVTSRYIEDTKLAAIEPEHLKDLWVPSDIWTMAISDLSASYGKKANAMYWMQLFDSKKLMMSEESNRFVRAEWSVGPEARIQVYFDKRKGSTPRFCRYLIPSNPKEHFSQKARILLTNIETDWHEFRGGWVPTTIKHERERFAVADQKPMSIEIWIHKMDWESTLCSDDGIDPRLFEDKSLKSEQVFQSFVSSKPSKK